MIYKDTFLRIKIAYIIGICGVRATGKSTIARNLGLIIRADILSSGRVREMVRAQYKHQELSGLFESVTNASSLDVAMRYLLVQAEVIKPSILAVMKQCREREANLIIEGTHIYPNLYKKELDLEVLLVAPREKLAYRMHKDKKRRFSEKILKLNSELQEHLKKKAEKYNIPIIDTTSIPSALIEIVKLLPSEKLLKTYFE